MNKLVICAYLGIIRGITHYNKKYFFINYDTSAEKRRMEIKKEFDDEPFIDAIKRIALKGHNVRWSE